MANVAQPPRIQPSAPRSVVSMILLLLVLLFWVASFLVLYPYTIYPLVLAMARGREPGRSANSLYEPNVTLIVSAYNEEAVIEQKLRNALSLQYPAEKLEILVVSDASCDGTDGIVKRIATHEPRIKLLRQLQRRGKSAGLNAALAEARGDILIFSDANAIYDECAISELVSCFDDNRVGYAVGAALYYDESGNRAAESEGLYWKLEIFLKRMESSFCSVVGGDGAIYAARRDLIPPLREDDISDFVTPLQIVAQGYVGRFNGEARCYEYAGESFAKEFGRKRRIVNRSWRAYRRYGRLVSSFQHRRFLFLLLSHKVLRWFCLPLIGIAWVTNTLLITTGWLYVVTWVAITASIGIALYGLLLERRSAHQPRPVALFYYFYMVHLAAALGIWDEWRGIRHVTWEHVRKQQS